MQCFSWKADINEHIKSDLEEESEQLEAKIVRAATRVLAPNPRDVDSVLSTAFSFHSDPSSCTSVPSLQKRDNRNLPTKKSIIPILI